MAAGRNIQVYGIDGVLQWYTSNGIPSWAVVCEKNVNAKYICDDMEEGGNMLSQYLEMAKKYDSAASYTLRMYEDTDKGIRLNTPSDMAFNFSLQDKNEPVAASNLPAVQGINNQTLTQLLREISELKTENAIQKMELEQADDYIEELEKQLKAQPVVQEKSMGVALLEKFEPVLTRLGENIAANMFGPRESALAGVPVNEQDEQLLIETAIDRLKGQCGKYSLGQVLSRIADIRLTDPGQFEFYLKMLMK